MSTQAYPLYPTRNIKSLDGIWDFRFLEPDGSFKTLDVNRVTYDDTMAVPGAFDAGPKYAGKRGCGIYRMQVQTEAGLFRLKIHGLGLRGRVFWDGKEIGATELAYSPLTVDFETVAGIHELVIATDNCFSKGCEALEYPNYDFYCYGGIYRSVELQKLPVSRIERAHVRVLDLEKGEISVRLLLGGDTVGATSCDVSFDRAAPVKIALKPEDGVAEFTARVPNPSIWSLEAPHLHTMRVALESGDEIVERFGLRTIQASNGRIFLNGKAIRLRGYCRHESNPQLGPALPDALHIEDVQFLKDSHCNYVRCVHYPQNQAFFDLCDQHGILVWTESLGWGDTVERLVNPTFGDLQESQTRQMVRDAINHPSVIIWAFLNEGESHKEESRALYARLIRAIREEDPTRLVSYASNRQEEDLSLKLVDVISLNVYPVWISDVTWDETHSLEAINQYVSRLAAFCSRGDLEDKPFIFSEIGACGLFGWRDRLSGLWSEDHQASYFVEAIRSIFENPRLSGVSLWQFYDIRTYPNGDARTKARTFNNAGVLDEYKRPKLAYAAVKAAYKAIAETEKHK